jgi:hypothetical protein
MIPSGARPRLSQAVVKMQQCCIRVFRLSEKIHQGLVPSKFSVSLQGNPFIPLLERLTGEIHHEEV